MSTRPCIFLLALLHGACAFGMTTERFVPANSPAGVRTQLRTPSGVLEGELLEVRDQALIVLSNESGPSAPPGTRAKQLLRLIPFRSIVDARFDQHGSGFGIGEGRTPSTSTRERLRLVSRFPYGMSPDIEKEMLKAHGQTSFAGVER